MGLIIAQKLCKSLDGSIKVYSQTDKLITIVFNVGTANQPLTRIMNQSKNLATAIRVSQDTDLTSDDTNAFIFNLLTRAVIPIHLVEAE